MMFSVGDKVEITQGKYAGHTGVVRAQATAPLARFGSTYRIRFTDPIKEVWCYEYELAKLELPAGVVAETLSSS